MPVRRANAGSKPLGAEEPQAHTPMQGLEKTATIVSALILAGGVVVFAFHNLGNRYFWTDESSTFLTALGWPNPGEASGSLARAWDGTMHGFLDPGLFHMLARVWASTLGTHIEVLRLMPFILFLAYLLCIALLARMVRAPWYVAMALASVMLLENITPYYAVEFRPYSGGLAAAVALPLAALALLHRNTWARLAVFALVYVFFSSMQYNAVALSAGLAVALLVTLLHARTTSERWRAAIALALCVLWLPVLHLATRGNPLADARGAVIYMDTVVLRYMDVATAAHTLFANLLSPTALPRTVFILLVPILWWARRLQSPLRSGHREEVAIGVLWLYVTIATLAAAVLAAIGVLPWVVGTRWSLPEIGLVACSLVGLSGIALMRLRPLTTMKTLSLVVLSVALCIAGAWRIATYERPWNIDYVRYLVPILLKGPAGSAVVDARLYEDVRYWLEYSGQYNNLRDLWLGSDVISTDPPFMASARDVQEFLRSDRRVLLLRSERALSDMGVAVPEGVTLVRIPSEATDGNDPLDLPVLLVKE